MEHEQAHKIPHFNFFTNSFIYRVNIGKGAILNKNIVIIGHFLQDRDFIGDIHVGTLEGLIV